MQNWEGFIELFCNFNFCIILKVTVIDFTICEFMICVICIYIFFFEKWRNALCTVKGTHSPRNALIPGLIHSCGTEVAQRHPRARTCNRPFLAAPPASPASVWPAAVSGSLPLCGQSQGSVSTDLPHFSCAPYRIPTRSWCGQRWEVSRLLPPPKARTPFCSLYRVSSLGRP